MLRQEYTLQQSLQAMQVTSLHALGKLPHLVRSALGIILALLSLTTLSGQKRILPLEEESKMKLVTIVNTEEIYFKDVNHILDKFVGSWKGTGHGGYDIVMQTKVFRKVYNDFDEDYSDVLAFKLEISRDGKPVPSPIGKWFYVPGATWYSGSGLDLDDDQVLKDTYTLYLDFNSQRKDGYWGQLAS